MASSFEFSDLVIVVPGILGSRLTRWEGSKLVTVWDLSLATLPGVLKAFASGSLKLDSHDGLPRDDVTARGLFRNQLLPGLIGVDDYDTLIGQLGRVASREGQVLPFAYDWRASNQHSAAALDAFAGEALRDWRLRSGASDAKLWLVCHSMGGLVARYYCEQLGGAADVRAVVTFGTPYDGAMKALDKLSNGMTVAGLLDLSALVRSLPSVHELLPLYDAVRVGSVNEPLQMHPVASFFDLDVGGADLPTPAGLQPLPGLQREAVRRALQFHQGLRAPIDLRRKQGLPTPYKLQAFFNRAQPTPLSGHWLDGRLGVHESYPQVEGGQVVHAIERGDGTVPSFAALPPDWDDSAAAIALPDMHAAIQSNESALGTLCNWMRPQQSRRRKGAAGDANVPSLRVPAALAAGDVLRVEVSAPSALNAQVEISLVTGGPPLRRPLQVPSGHKPVTVELGRPSEGVHRVRVLPAGEAAPVVSDLCCVIAA